MQGIPLICTDDPAVALCPPLYLSSARVNTYIEGTKSLAAILNNCHLDINQTSPIQTTCSSHFAINNDLIIALMEIEDAGVGV